MYCMLASLDVIPTEVKDESTQLIGGIVGNKLNGGVDFIKDGITEIGVWLLEGLFNITTPFVVYGCKICIVGFTVAFYLSEDKRHLANILKCFIIFYLFVMIKGALT